MEQSTSTLIVLKELAGNPLPQLNTIQKTLVPHVKWLTVFWISVCIMTVCILLVKVWYEYKNQKESGK